MYYSAMVNSRNRLSPSVFEEIEEIVDESIGIGWHLLTEGILPPANDGRRTISKKIYGDLQGQYIQIQFEIIYELIIGVSRNAEYDITFRFLDEDDVTSMFDNNPQLTNMPFDIESRVFTSEEFIDQGLWIRGEKRDDLL